MATNTTVGIVNHALILCGSSKITALTDDTANARTLNAIYETARKDFLVECRWTFALTRASLVTSASTYILPWTYSSETQAFDVPSNSLRIWQMSDIEAQWRQEGDRIISDTSSLGTLYTWDHDEVGLWTPKATMAFIDYLCYQISFHLLNSADKANKFLEKYEKVTLPAAQAVDAQTGTHQEVVDNEWLQARGGGGRPDLSYG